MLQEILLRISRRDHPRSEAEVQADIRQFILEAPFELDEGDLDIVSLESPVSGGRRIDVEVGSAVIEVKRDLRRGRVLDEAVQQLGGYVRTRTAETGRRYVGVLTDGAPTPLIARRSPSFTSEARTSCQFSQKRNPGLEWAPGPGQNLGS